MLNTDTKNEIVQEAKNWMEINNVNNAELSKISKVNDSYLSHILNGKLTAPAGGKEVEIKDQYFVRIAEVIGKQVENDFWGHVETLEDKQISFYLGEAKQQSITRTVICPTGRGKTYIVKRFKLKNPKHTYVVTINSEMTINDIIRELMELMGLPFRGNKALRIADIIRRFREDKRKGNKPILIFDEAENMNPSTMRMIKGLYDGICEDHFASIVLMGTNQLEWKMQTARAKDKESAPQFYRRFKAGIRRIIVKDTDVTFLPFFERFGIKDKDFQRLLTEVAENYGELHDYLEPALREAYNREEALTEDFFRRMYNMPR